jgi:hypothetical protein
LVIHLFLYSLLPLPLDSFVLRTFICFIFFLLVSLFLLLSLFISSFLAVPSYYFPFIDSSLVSLFTLTYSFHFCTFCLPFRSFFPFIYLRCLLSYKALGASVSQRTCPVDLK